MVGAGRIDADRNRTDQAGPHLRQHPFDTVLRNDADVTTRLDTQCAQAEAEVAGTAIVVLPADRVPDAEILLPDGDPVRLLLGALAQHLRQRQVFQFHAHDSHRLRRL